MIKWHANVIVLRKPSDLYKSSLLNLQKLVLFLKAFNFIVRLPKFKETRIELLIATTVVEAEMQEYTGKC